MSGREARHTTQQISTRSYLHVYGDYVFGCACTHVGIRNVERRHVREQRCRDEVLGLRPFQHPSRGCVPVLIVKEKILGLQRGRALVDTHPLVWVLLVKVGRIETGQ